MQYPKEFKAKVLSLLGDSYEMRKMLDNGQESVGRIICDFGFQGSVSAYEIVDACESMNLQEIYKKAKRQIELDNLYKEWLELANNQRRGMHR